MHRVFRATRVQSDPWFCKLEKSDAQALVDKSVPVSLHAGEFVFRQGESPTGFYCLVSGMLKVSTLHPDGKEAILAVLEAGNWFGAPSVIDGLPHAHDISASDDSELLFVAHASFHELMRRNSFALSFARLQSMQARAVFSMLEDATLRSIRARVARRIKRLMHSDVTMSAPERLVIPITHDTLAMMLGVTRQTLAGELKYLVAQGAIALGYGRINVVSVERLEAVERDC